MHEQVKADIVIFGGGIAGLWALTRLRQAGYAALLIETKALGAGQTAKSQGIIHGGMKYALTGQLTAEATSMAGLPALWQACLQGQGEVDLHGVGVLSQHQYLWSPGSLMSRMTGFLAGMAMKSRVSAVDKTDYPTVFCDKAFKGRLYALDEIVLDVFSLLSKLAALNHDAIIKVEPFTRDQLVFNDAGEFVSAQLKQGERSLNLAAQHVVFAAGEGNAVVLDRLPTPQVAMQLRPLHMVMVKTPFDYSLYAHCMGVGPRPRLTVTTHRNAHGENVWYLGGLLAEVGVDRDEDQQIKVAKQELMTLFPWLDFSEAQFATLRVNRAEPHQASGLKPEGAFLHTEQNVSIAWPTKLALAPLLSEDIIKTVKARRIAQSESCLLKDWPKPSVAQPNWEMCTWKNVD